MEEKTMSSNSSESDGVQHSKEEQKVGELRAFIRARDPMPCQEEEDQKTDDLTLRRFLRARELDVEKAGALFCKYLSWRRSFVPKGSISEADIPNDLGQNKMFLQGYDMKGRPIGLFLAARHFYHKQGGLDEFKRFVVYIFDKMCARVPAGNEKFVVIGDLQGWGYSNSDIHGYLAVLSILQDFYPERLGKVYILHTPRIFMTVWKIIYPFIDTKTRAKIVFVDDKSLKSTLLEDIDEAQLPEMYGGKLPLVPIHLC